MKNFFVKRFWRNLLRSKGPLGGFRFYCLCLFIFMFSFFPIDSSTRETLFVVFKSSLFFLFVWVKTRSQDGTNRTDHNFLEIGIPTTYCMEGQKRSSGSEDPNPGSPKRRRSSSDESEAETIPSQTAPDVSLEKSACFATDGSQLPVAGGSTFQGSDDRLAQLTESVDQLASGGFTQRQLAHPTASPSPERSVGLTPPSTSGFVPDARDSNYLKNQQPVGGDQSDSHALSLSDTPEPIPIEAGAQLWTPAMENAVREGVKKGFEAVGDKIDDASAVAGAFWMGQVARQEISKIAGTRVGATAGAAVASISLLGSSTVRNAVAAVAGDAAVRLAKPLEPDPYKPPSPKEGFMGEAQPQTVALGTSPDTLQHGLGSGRLSLPNEALGKYENPSPSVSDHTPEPLDDAILSVFETPQDPMILFVISSYIGLLGTVVLGLSTIALGLMPAHRASLFPAERTERATPPTFWSDPLWFGAFAWLPKLRASTRVVLLFRVLRLLSLLCVLAGFFFLKLQFDGSLQIFYPELIHTISTSFNLVKYLAFYTLGQELALTVMGTNHFGFRSRGLKTIQSVAQTIFCSNLAFFVRVLNCFTLAAFFIFFIWYFK